MDKFVIQEGVNATGLPTLKAGGAFSYPDGTIVADDVDDFSVKDGATFEGATTGGWGFQV